MIGWELICTVFPNHKMIDRFHKFLKSPEYLAKSLGSTDSIDDINLSMSNLGHLPKYHESQSLSCPPILYKGTDNSNSITFKSEPI